MYDFTIDLIHTLFKNGLTLSSLGAVVFLILRQRKMKNRLKRFLPWMFGDDSEVKEYVRNQLVIMENMERIMVALGVTPCERNGFMTKSSPPDPKSLNILSRLLQTVTAQGWRSRRERKMKKLIATDDGHGMLTPGKRTPLFADGTYMPENEFNRAVVDKLNAHLVRCGFDVLHVAPGDEDVSLRRRTNLANNTIPNGFGRSADVYISVHANALGGIWNSLARGIETFYSKGSVKGKRLAQIVHKHMLQGTKLKDRGLKTNSLHVTRETDMPAILVECGFMDNPEESQLLKSDAYRAECAEEIARGVCEYFDMPYVEDDKQHGEMDITVHADAKKKYTGYNIKGATWIPSRPIGEMLGGRIGYREGKVTINGEPVDTRNFGGTGYVQARDLTRLLNARIFWDKESPNKVEIYTRTGE